MAKASANKVDIHSRAGTYQFKFRNSLGSPNLCYPVNPKALELAVMHGNIACIEYLLQNGANIDQETEASNLDNIYHGTQMPQCRILTWAIRYNQPQAIQFLLARGVGILLSSHVPEFKPMHLAAALGHVDLFEMLLAIPGCAIDDTDSRGYTPLHYASLGARALDCWGLSSETGDTRLSSIRGLLQRGATTIAGVTGATALEFSFRSDKDWDWQASFLLLAAAPPALIPRDELVSSAIICAQMPRTRDVLFRRLLAGGPVSRLYPSGRGNLTMRCGWDRIPSGNPEFRVSLLIWSIVEHDLMPWLQHTDTLEWADTLPELLLNIGANPNLADGQGRTPLHACVFSSLSSLCDNDEKWDDETAQIFSPSTPHRDRPFPYNVIAELVRRNGSLYAQDDEGRTPLDYALDTLDRMEIDDEEPELPWAASWYAWRVTKLTLKVAHEFGMCPSDALKVKLMMRLGRDVVHPDDPLAAQEGKEIGVSESGW